MTVATLDPSNPQPVHAREMRKIQLGADLQRALAELAEGKDPDAIRARLAVSPKASAIPCEFTGGQKLAHALIDDTQRRCELAKSGKLTGIPTKLPTLDRLTGGLQPGELTVIGGRTSHGKTALALTVIANACADERTPTVFLSLEMPAVALARRLSSQIGGIPMKRIRDGDMTQADFKRMTNAVARIKDAPLTITDDRRLANIDNALAALREEVQRTGAKLVVIDYLQKLNAGMRQEKRTYEVAAVSNALQAFAQEQSVALVALAQVNRDPERSSTPDDAGRLPRLCDLADSSGIEKDGDLVLLLHRPPMATEGKLVIAKGRDVETGIIDLIYHAQFLRFEEAPDPAFK